MKLVTVAREANNLDMASIIQPAIESPFITVGQLLESTPDIPPSRIRLSPTPGTATEADVLAVHANEKVLCELVDGMLVEKPMGLLESVLAMFIGIQIGNYLQTHKLGIVAGADGMMQLAAGLVRIPDVSFVSWDQMPGRTIPSAPIPNLHPDLAVEVLSRSNTNAEIERKIGEYFISGTRLIWIVDPTSRTVRVLTSMNNRRMLSEHETLDGGEVLPGFTLPIADIFSSSRDV